jgi:hypothetical protein
MNIPIADDGTFSYEYITANSVVSFSGKFDSRKHGLITYEVTKCDSQKVMNRFEDVEFEWISNMVP